MDNLDKMDVDKMVVENRREHVYEDWVEGEFEEMDPKFSIPEVVYHGETIIV